jgi:GT2 family glycosyltransferase
MIAQVAPGWDGRLTYVRREPNGPASARNTGLQLSSTPFVLFLDSDVDLAEDWIARALAHCAAQANLAAVGGHILYAFDTTRVNAYGGDIGRLGLAWDVDEGTALDPSRGPAPRIWINCSAMLARADVVRGAGGFDETFFYGYEDSDLGWRLNLAGWGVAVFPDLRATHNVPKEPSVASPDIVFHYSKNRLRSVLKNASARALPLMLAGYAAFSLTDMLARPPRRSKIRALAWNLAHLSETLSMRREIQERRVVPDSTVLALGSRRWLPPTPLGGMRRRPSESERPRGLLQSKRSAADDRI